MPAGFSNAALELAVNELVDRTIQVRLHHDDPGASGTENAIHASNGYAHVTLSQGAITQETGSRYSNTSDITFPTATGGNWGDGTSDQPVSWISLWYDANNPANTNTGDFDTHMASLQLASSQQVNNGDPFVIRSRTLDLITSNQSG